VKPGADQDLTDFKFVASLIDDAETVVDLFAQLEEGRRWLCWRGWTWAEQHDSLETSYASWTRARTSGGMNLKYVVERMYEKTPQTLQALEKVRETTLTLLTKEPDKIVCMCVWLSTVHFLQSALCASVMRRLLSLDDRLNPKLDWRVEAAMCFDETQYEGDNDGHGEPTPKIV
jgi:hypothetical protein